MSHWCRSSIDSQCDFMLRCRQIQGGGRRRRVHFYGCNLNCEVCSWLHLEEDRWQTDEREREKVVAARNGARHMQKPRQVKRGMDAQPVWRHKNLNPLDDSEVRSEGRERKQKEQGWMCSEYKSCTWMRLPSGVSAFLDMSACMHNCVCECVFVFW